MEVEVEVLEKEYKYNFEGGKVRIYIKTRGECVKEIDIYDERGDKFKDYHLRGFDIPIELLGVLAEALEDLRYRAY